MRLYPFRIWIGRGKAGVTSEGPCWICCYGCWMHVSDTLPGLVWDVIWYWKSDHNIIW